MKGAANNLGGLANGNLGYKATMIGGRYTVAGLTIGLMGEEVKRNGEAGDPDVKITRMILPVTYSLNPSTTLLATVMRTDRPQQVGGIDTDVRDTTDWAIGVNYALSSRTSVRAAYMYSDKILGTPAVFTTIVPEALVEPTKTVSGFSVFVRHAF
jgi:predicted porin